MTLPELKSPLVHLLLLLPAKTLPNKDDEVYQVVHALLSGDFEAISKDSEVSAALESPQVLKVLQQLPHENLRSALDDYVSFLVHQLPAVKLQLLAIALLQSFIQNNFTGPQSEFSKFQISTADQDKIQYQLVSMLSIEGKSAYDLMNQPLLLILALLLLEKLQNVQYSLIQHGDSSIEQISQDTIESISKLDISEPLNASLLWWRARALQVHLSVISEPSDILAATSSLLLQEQLVGALASSDSERHLHLLFLLESARTGIHAHTEHLAEPFLHTAESVSQFQLALTGARAKRTKFQTFHTASLVLLAKSHELAITVEEASEAPESIDLNSDLLLEKPIYESLEDVAADIQPDSKKIRLDSLDHLVPDQKRLLPISVKADDLPLELRDLDPNSQPPLADLDKIQLLLRYTVLRQTSPSGSAMVDEELSAVVNRIVYSVSKSENWLVFGRALWERSVLETNKARTVERGILQMTALVEEIGLKIKTRVMPKSEGGDDAELAASRLRYIHQLPLMAQWTMDAKLAEKYMSLGVLRSAIEIYERLNMLTEAALCYAAVDDEPQAERLLEQRISTHPQDARAYSVLGDVRQDPQLWEKAWSVGKYANAKASLSRYYYQPPMGSGLERNIALAMGHMQDCLTASPLSYENWFFYGCCGLETGNFEVAAEAFTRCVSLDDTNSHAWSNLASALLRIEKTKQAFVALKRALQQGEGAKRSWRIFENYLTVAAKLGEWNDVLHASRELVKLLKDGNSEIRIDIAVIERLAQILMEDAYPEEGRLTHFQSSCIDLVCNLVPSAVNEDARLWRINSKVELWRERPWAALDCLEKAYRQTSLNPELGTNEEIWNEAVSCCEDLVSAYENLGERPGKHGAGDVVCKDWKYKARMSVRSLMSKGKLMWEDSDGWERLVAAKEEVAAL